MSVEYNYTDSVRTDVVVEKLTASSIPSNYLNKFPDELYNKSPDSNLYKFIFTLVGPSGVGALKEDLFKARLALEANGIRQSELERFYGDVFRFSKILSENYSIIPSQTLSQSGWAEIKAKDESYRNRAIDYLHAVRLGATPDGMRLASKSALGRDAEIVENYQFLFDNHSDDPIGLSRYGKTNAISEFVILPHYEEDSSYAKTLIFSLTPDSGSCQFSFNGNVSSVINFKSLNTQNVSNALNEIGISARVSGDYTNGFLILTSIDYAFTFINNLSASSSRITHTITTVVGTQDAQGIQDISIREQYDLQLALDNLKPVDSIFTYSNNQSSLKRQNWTSVDSTSNQIDVIRFVTGSEKVNWPTPKGAYWIEANVEKEGPKVFNDNRQHYQAFHTPSKIYAYRDEALADPSYLTSTSVLSSYISNFTGSSFGLDFPYHIEMSNQDFDSSQGVYSAKYALPIFAETQTSRTAYATPDGGNVGLINGIYPVDYLNLQGVPQVSSTNRLWASAARPAVDFDNVANADILEIDLGSIKAVNFILFEVAALPFDIKIEYDILDQNSKRSFVEVTPEQPYPFEKSIYYEGQTSNPWEPLSYNFTDSMGNIIFTRFIRITFTRRNESNNSNPLFYDNNDNTQINWPIAVRNLRIGRNV